MNGHFADTLGRRRLTLVSIAGFSTCTTAMGLLPGYAAWGAAAPEHARVGRYARAVFETAGPGAVARAGGATAASTAANAGGA